MKLFTETEMDAVHEMWFMSGYTAGQEDEKDWVISWIRSKIGFGYLAKAIIEAIEENKHRG